MAQIFDPFPLNQPMNLRLVPTLNDDTLLPDPPINLFSPIIFNILCVFGPNIEIILIAVYGLTRHPIRWAITEFFL